MFNLIFFQANIMDCLHGIFYIAQKYSISYEKTCIEFLKYCTSPNIMHDLVYTVLNVYRKVNIDEVLIQSRVNIADIQDYVISARQNLIVYKVPILHILRMADKDVVLEVLKEKELNLINVRCEFEADIKSARSC